MSRPVIAALALLALSALAALALAGSGPALWHDAVAQIAQYQRDLHRGLADAMMALSSRQGVTDWLDLMALALGYGVFHALGPGHGKAVVATYLMTQRAALARGLIMTVASALLQGLVAIALVLVLVLGLELLTREAMGATRWVERASFLAVTLLGGFLIYRSGRRLWQLRQRQKGEERNPCKASSEHGFFYPVGRGDVEDGLHPPVGLKDRAPVCSHCGRAHHVDPARIGSGRLEMAGAILSIGLRPCSGAVLVLGVAAMLGFWWAGVLAVAAMSVGTALSTSLLAAVTVFARARMARASGFTPKRWQRQLAHGVALGGGAVIFLLGVTLLTGDATTPGSPLLGA